MKKTYLIHYTRTVSGRTTIEANSGQEAIEKFNSCSAWFVPSEDTLTCIVDKVQGPFANESNIERSV